MKGDLIGRLCCKKTAHNWTFTAITMCMQFYWQLEYVERVSLIIVSYMMLNVLCSISICTYLTSTTVSAANCSNISNCLFHLSQELFTKSIIPQSLFLCFWWSKVVYCLNFFLKGLIPCLMIQYLKYLSSSFLKKLDDIDFQPGPL